MGATLRILAVGDILLGEQYVTLGRGMGTMLKRRGVHYAFEAIRPTLQEADILFGNLEAPLAKPRRLAVAANAFRGCPEAAEALAWAGFDVLSLANNHMLEHGAEVALETIEHLSSQGIHSVGCAASQQGAREALILTRGGRRIAFLAFTFVPIPPRAPDLTARESVEGLCERVAARRSRCDLLLLSLHWGAEYMDVPSPFQVHAAHRLIDAGADVILGHHPHVLQGIESYNGGLIAYSLGNFVFDMHFCCETRLGAILAMTVEEGALRSYELLPVYINDAFQPTLMADEEKDQVLAYLDDCTARLPNPQSDDPLQAAQRYVEYVAQRRREIVAMQRRYYTLGRLSPAANWVRAWRRLRRIITGRSGQVAPERAHEAWLLGLTDEKIEVGDA